MKKCLFILVILLLVFTCMQTEASAQCSLCTKTAQQMGEKPAQGLNSGILYLMGVPFMLMGYIGFRWWKNNKEVEQDEQKQSS